MLLYLFLSVSRLRLTTDKNFGSKDRYNLLLLTYIRACFIACSLLLVHIFLISPLQSAACLGVIMLILM